MPNVIKIFGPAGFGRGDGDNKQIIDPAIAGVEECEIIPLEEMPGWFFSRPDLDDRWKKIHVDLVILCRVNEERATKCVEWFKNNKPNVKIICVDYFDGDRLQRPHDENIFYFKRNMVKMENNRPKEVIDYFPYKVIHSSYCVREDILSKQLEIGELERDLDFSCFFESPDPKQEDIELAHELGLLDVVKTLWDGPCKVRRLGRAPGSRYNSRMGIPWVLKILKNQNCHIGKTASVCAEDGRQGRKIHEEDSPLNNYIRLMARSKIVVTACPSAYEGDFRLMEAMTSGALVMHNKMGLPPKGLEDGKHWIVYDDPAEMLEKLLYYLERPDLTAEIGRAAKEFVINNHRPHHRMKEWLKHIDLYE